MSGDRTIRRRLLRALEEAWERHPHLRLGQLIIAALQTQKEDFLGRDTFYVPDERMEEALRAFDSARPPQNVAATLYVHSEACRPLCTDPKCRVEIRNGPPEDGMRLIKSVGPIKVYTRDDDASE